MPYLTLKCCECQEDFQRTASEDRKSQGRKFCSRSCSVSFNNKTRPKRTLINKCKMCSVLIVNSRSYCNECLPKYFQSLRSVNKENTKTKVKIKEVIEPKKCKTCDELIFASRQKCQKCIDNYTAPDMTISEAIYTKHHKSSAFALIRSRARGVAKKEGWNCCSLCGYDKHIEIAHIKPIRDFPEDVMVSVVNDVSNLKPLCPNCHWEFDHPCGTTK